MKRHYFQLKGFVKENLAPLTTTMITEIIIVLLSLLSFRFASEFGESGFAEYSLGRRIISTVFPFVLLGTPIIIVKYVAQTNIISEQLYLQKLAIFVWLAATSFLLGTVFIFPNFSQSFLTNNELSSAMLIFVLISAIAIGLQSINYSLLRGRQQFHKANITQIITVGVIPIIAISTASSVTNSFMVQGFVVLAFSMIVAISFQVIKKTPNKEAPTPHQLEVKPPQLMKMSIGRFFGDASIGLLMGLPAIIATKDHGSLVGGQMAFAISILVLFASTLSPMNYLLLPKASKFVKEGNLFELRTLTNVAISVALLASVFQLVISYIFYDEIISFFTKDSFSIPKELVMTVLVSNFGYNMYVSCRGIIDARFIRSINTYNVVIALLSFIGLYYFLPEQSNSYLKGSTALSIAFTILGIASIFVLKFSRMPALDEKKGK